MGRIKLKSVQTTDLIRHSNAINCRIHAIWVQMKAGEKSPVRFLLDRLLLYNNY